MNTLLKILLTLLPLAAASPISGGGCPAGNDSTTHGCQAVSFGRPIPFAWTVKDFRYHASYTFTTPAHQNSWGYVDFSLSNPALAPAVAKCSAASNQLSDFFYGTMKYNCELPDGTPVGGGSGGQASFDFSRPSGVFNINQTWSCRDADPQFPTTLWAYGNTTFALDCQETNYQNPNWTSGQIYSSRTIECAPVTLKIEPHTMEAIA